MKQKIKFFVAASAVLLVCGATAEVNAQSGSRGIIQPAPAASGTRGFAPEAGSGTSGFAPQAGSGTSGFAPQASGSRGFVPQAGSGTSGFLPSGQFDPAAQNPNAPQYRPILGSGLIGAQEDGCNCFQLPEFNPQPEYDIYSSRNYWDLCPPCTQGHAPRGDCNQPRVDFNRFIPRPNGGLFGR